MADRRRLPYCGVLLLAAMVTHSRAVAQEISIRLTESTSVKRVARDIFRVRPDTNGELSVAGIVVLPPKDTFDDPVLTKVVLVPDHGADVPVLQNGKDYVQPTPIGNLKFVDLTSDGTWRFTAIATVDTGIQGSRTGQKLSGNQIQLIVDRTAPMLSMPVASRLSGDSVQLQLSLEDSDIDPKSVSRNAFKIVFENETAARDITDGPHLLNTNQTIELVFTARGSGKYRVFYKDLKDDVGNPTAGPATTTKSEGTTVNSAVADPLGGYHGLLEFAVDAGAPPPRRGKQIEYPEYVGPKGRETLYFNPHEKVDSRVIRLYYFRDAHRVVQIINRNVEKLNLDRVNFERDLANRARENADDATAARRVDEQKAIQSVQRARQARRDIEKAEATLARNRSAKAELLRRQRAIEATVPTDATKDSILPPLPGESLERKQQLEDDNTDITEQIQLLQAKNAESTTTEAVRQSNLKAIKTLERQKRDNQTEINQITGNRTFQEAQDKAQLKAEQETIQEQISIVDESIRSAQATIASANAELSRAQAEEAQNTVTVLTSQDREDRARAQQFRQEVIAGTTDPDTYAAGTIESVDPVTQVSMSVIGEGIIQLRGPSKGINKIARIIHQIDTPVGQVKVGIQTVQINGEHGDRMEYVYERIDKHIAQARFLTHESMQLFRRAVQEVASEIAIQVDEGYVPPDMDEWSAECAQLTGANLRHWRYVNAFFGGDFIRELREMDSELLKHDNKLLSLHSMDTISLAGALYVTAVAKHSVRMMILDRFLGFVQSELPRKEVDYYRALTRIRHADPCVNHILMEHFGQKHDLKDATKIWEKALRTYQFSNFVGFFDMQLAGEDTLNNVQHATIRMAQALKAQLVAELEFKNLVLEKSLLEPEGGALARVANSLNSELESVGNAERQTFDAVQSTQGTVQAILTEMSRRLPAILNNAQRDLVQPRDDGQNTLETIVSSVNRNKEGTSGATSEVYTAEDAKEFLSAYVKAVTRRLENQRVVERIVRKVTDEYLSFDFVDYNDPKFLAFTLDIAIEAGCLGMFGDSMVPELRDNEKFAKEAENNHELHKNVVEAMLTEMGNSATSRDLRKAAKDLFVNHRELETQRQKVEARRREFNQAREKALAGRVLDEAIDETELKAVELLEATRAHVANVDNYLKRLAVALEDDVNAQFYNPAIMDVRRASRYWDVTLSQVENTTVLTNNRAFAKVSPTATMELDLPARDILLTEAVKGGKALVTEYGNLLKDPTFLAATALSGGQPPLGLNSRQSFLQGVPDSAYGTPGAARPEFGAALEALIPDPAVYKFETGTGFEIRPVIQPDGHSIVYTFDYMYTTNVREPVRADEKHLGRVKRHFVHTDVQTSSYEMREISRYNVAIKASRTSRGVPLLEDVPGVGVLFRPLPSQESSLQQNIILGMSTIYPTLFDLMGLRWSPYAEDLHSEKLALSKPREREISQRYRNVLLRKARAAVREDIGGEFELPAELPSDYREPPLQPEEMPNGPRVSVGRRGSVGATTTETGSRSSSSRTAQREMIDAPPPVRSGPSRVPARRTAIVEDTDEVLDLEPPRGPRLAPPANSGAARQRRSNVQLAAEWQEVDEPAQRLPKSNRQDPAAGGRRGSPTQSKTGESTTTSKRLQNPINAAAEAKVKGKPQSWSHSLKR